MTQSKNTTKAKVFNTSTENKPIKDYQKEKSFVKTRYVIKLEEEVFKYNIDNPTYEKLVSSMLQTLSKLNPSKKIIEVDYLVQSLSEVTEVDELKSIIRLINSKLKSQLKPKNDIVYKLPKKDTTLDKNRVLKILFDKRFVSVNLFFRIFYALSFLTYTNDKNVIFRVNNLSDNGVIDYALKNFKFFKLSKEFLDTLYAYGGGKKKFYKHLNNHIREVIAKNDIKQVVDYFMGGIGSFYSMYNPIKENNLKVVLNDKNPTIYQLNKNVQGVKNHKNIIKSTALIVQKMFKKYDTYKLSHIQYREYHLRLLKVVNRLERKGDIKTLGSSILLFVMNNGFGGNYKVNKNGSYISPSTDTEKYTRIFNFVTKIEFYHYLYTSVKVKFTNKDYKDMLKDRTNSKHTYMTFDPPYLKENLMSISEYYTEKTRLDGLIVNATNKKDKNKYIKQIDRLLEGTSYNYGELGDKFPHEELLKDIGSIKGHISYFNYRHPVIEEYKDKYNLDMNTLERKSTNGRTEKGKEVQKKYEVFMTGQVS